jgi:hypothetical protein
MSQLLGDVSELVDEVLDILQGTVDPRRPHGVFGAAGTVGSVMASRGTGPAGVVGL